MTALAPDDAGVAIRMGLSAKRKWLPPFLFYDEEGSRLFDEITELPEYYLTRTERSILDGQVEAIARELLVSQPLGGTPGVFELGAGSAIKTDVLLRAIHRSRADLRYFPADVSPTALERARERLTTSTPDLAVVPLVGTHADAISSIRSWVGPRVVLYLGSSLGNYEDREAIRFLSAVGDAMGPTGRMLLGLDRTKPIDVLLPAYDDRKGITAAFNLNVLRRINQEFEGDFRIDTFRHVALWNEAASAIEMHLESVEKQSVRLRRLDMVVEVAKGERIHTESSHKYSAGRIEGLLVTSGLREVRSFQDDRSWFSLHVLRGAT